MAAALEYEDAASMAMSCVDTLGKTNQVDHYYVCVVVLLVFFLLLVRKT